MYYNNPNHSDLLNEVFGYICKESIDYYSKKNDIPIEFKETIVKNKLKIKFKIFKEQVENNKYVMIYLQYFGVSYLISTKIFKNLKVSKYTQYKQIYEIYQIVLKSVILNSIFQTNNLYEMKEYIDNLEC